MSHETIYRSLYVQARGVLKKELIRHLRSKRTMRRPRRAGDKRGQIVDLVSQRVHEANSAQHQPTGAKYLAGGFNNATALSGASPANRVVLLQFESIDKAKAWYADGQAEREKKLGSKVASSFRILAIEGVNQ